MKIINTLRVEFKRSIISPLFWGTVAITCNCETLNLAQGDSILLPANLEISIEGNGELLEALPK